MNNFNSQLETFKTSPSMAYLAYKQDPTANKTVSFETFCNFMKKAIDRRKREDKIHIAYAK